MCVSECECGVRVYVSVCACMDVYMYIHCVCAIFLPKSVYTYLHAQTRNMSVCLLIIYTNFLCVHKILDFSDI